MFRKVLSLACFAALGGCSAISSLDPTVAPYIAAAQSATAAACGLLPTAESIAGLFTSGTPLADAEAVAKIICAAAGSSATASHRFRGRMRTHLPVTVMVNGKPVKVTFQ
jgi:hypothetical protein